MATAKTSRPKRAAKPKALAEGATITIAMPDGATPSEAEALLAKQIPGWENLNHDQKVELAEIALAQRQTREPVKVTLTPKPTGGLSIGFGDRCEAFGLLKLQKAFSAVTTDPVNARAAELLNYLGSVGADNEVRYNAALSFIESMDPQNQAEVLLLVQMYATHDAAIRALSQLGRAEWVDNAKMYGNLAAKLLRASQGQMETLARMRRGGEQVVRHIHVDNRGGQAIIAENVQTGGKHEKINDQSHATGAAGEGQALLGADPQGNGVPIPGGAGPEPVPDARRDQSRRAER